MKTDKIWKGKSKKIYFCFGKHVLVTTESYLGVGESECSQSISDLNLLQKLLNAWQCFLALSATLSFSAFFLAYPLSFSSE